MPISMDYVFDPGGGAILWGNQDRSFSVFREARIRAIELLQQMEREHGDRKHWVDLSDRPEGNHEELLARYCPERVLHELTIEGAQIIPVGLDGIVEQRFPIASNTRYAAIISLGSPAGKPTRDGQRSASGIPPGRSKTINYVHLYHSDCGWRWANDSPKTWPERELRICSDGKVWWVEDEGGCSPDFPSELDARVAAQNIAGYGPKYIGDGKGSPLVLQAAARRSQENKLAATEARAKRDDLDSLQLWVYGMFACIALFVLWLLYIGSTSRNGGPVSPETEAQWAREEMKPNWKP